jgi:cyclopropane-fatty-acyl-phospholipid synthase
MGTLNKEISDRLASEGIFGPGSEELVNHERHLTRFFVREYQRLSDNPVSLESLGITTDRGPMMEDTEALMDSHYDERPEFFTCFLDKQYKAYSMAYYGEIPDAIRTSTASLEEAQRAKFALIEKRARITGHERILNIGCGFGSLETYLLKEFPNLGIVGVTPSKVQANYLRQRMQNSLDPLGSGQFTLVEEAFEQLSDESINSEKFDIVISIGTLEHSLNMKAIMARISSLLKPQGMTFHHFITSELTIPQFLDPTNTRIGMYFPGGRVWPHDEFSRHTDHFDLEENWFINGLNYWRTLDEWHRRYWENIPSLYKSVFDTTKIAHWNEYFSLCKAVFAPMEGNFYGNSHYLFRKPG